jgi:chaperonin GroES
MDIRPLHDRIIIKREEEQEVKKGGIIIPDTAKEKPQKGNVIAVGQGKRADDGTLIPPVVKKGDRVLFGKYAGTEYKSSDDEELIIMREDDILAIIE